MSARWGKRASRRPRREPTRAERVMFATLARPVCLPEGADPELGRLFGLGRNDG